MTDSQGCQDVDYEPPAGVLLGSLAEITAASECDPNAGICDSGTSF